MKGEGVGGGRGCGRDTWAVELGSNGCLIKLKARLRDSDEVTERDGGVGKESERANPHVGEGDR